MEAPSTACTCDGARRRGSGRPWPPALPPLPPPAGTNANASPDPVDGTPRDTPIALRSEQEDAGAATGLGGSFSVREATGSCRPLARALAWWRCSHGHVGRAAGWDDPAGYAAARPVFMRLAGPCFMMFIQLAHHKTTKPPPTHHTNQNQPHPTPTLPTRRELFGPRDAVRPSEEMYETLDFHAPRHRQRTRHSRQ